MGSNERKGKIGDKDDKSKWDDQDVDVDNLPEGQTAKKDKGSRIHVRDKERNYRLRVDPADKKGGEHKHYYDKNNSSQHLDKNGNPCNFSEVLSHIQI